MFKSQFTACVAKAVVSSHLSIPLAALLTAISVQPVVAATQDGFHYSAPLSEGSASLRRAELPWQVLSHLLQEGQADVRVYNADNQAVPASVRPVAAEPVEAELRSLAFFSGDDPERLGTLLTLQAGSSQVNLTPLTQTGGHYLIIHNPDIAGKPTLLQKLELQWEGLEQWLPSSLAVETSNDLQHWEKVDIDGLPYVLQEKGVRLENRLLKFSQPIQARFIRLSGKEDFAALIPALGLVAGYVGGQSPSVAARWQAVNLSAGDTPQQFRYELPISVPVSQWRMPLEQLGSLYEGTLSSRYGAAARYGARANEWQVQGDFRHYRLQTAGGELRSEPVEVPAYGYGGREWQLDFRLPNPLPASTQIELGWQPLEVRFVAQGKAPFRLVYGSRATDLPSAMTFDAALEKVTPETVQVGEESVLAPVVPETNRPWLVFLLWGVLVAAVGLLLWMGKRLFKEMKAGAA